MDPVTAIAAISAAITLTEKVVAIMEERKRRRELTPEEEAEWDRFKAERMTAPHWQPSFVRRT
jgi:hypothetical protein